jgi:serine/threonine protein kinase
MSPEQATGRDIAAPCDVYSLGVIAYEALAGHPPFDGRTLAEVVCMHLTRAPAPLRARCHAPAELCNLVGWMLHKDPATRPGAAEVRQIARAIARELSQAYEEFELSEIEVVDRDAARARMQPAYTVPSDEVEVIDAEALEYGVTEMLPVVRQPRWTPEISGLPSVLAERPSRSPVAPRAPRDQVAGEILAIDKSR